MAIRRRLTGTGEVTAYAGSSPVQSFKSLAEAIRVLSPRYNCSFPMVTLLLKNKHGKTLHTLSWTPYF